MPMPPRSGISRPTGSRWRIRSTSRCGYGMRLLADLIARCQALGKRQMIAVIGGSQSAGFIGLHNRMGFETAGVLRSAGFKLGDWTDSVLMTRALGARGSAPPEDAT
jgi:L-amino acid N-acyltransferase YncA